MDTAMFREEKSEKVPLHLMPGYVSNLHQRDPGAVICAVCDAAWPCPSARRQLADAARFTSPFWLNNERLDAIARESAAAERAEAARKAKSAKKKSEAEAEPEPAAEEISA